jgi:hypothetical protein
LRDSTGKVISNTKINIPSQTGTVRRDITVLERFNGKVLGLKYYKGSALMTPEFYYFWEFTGPENALLAYYFNSTGIVPRTTDSFRNYGFAGGSLTIPDPNNMKIVFG